MRAPRVVADPRASAPAPHASSARARSERWIVTRAALRILLGARLGCVPEEVAILIEEHGKPYVLRRPPALQPHPLRRPRADRAGATRRGRRRRRAAGPQHRRGGAHAVGRRAGHRRRPAADLVPQGGARQGDGRRARWAPEDFDTTSPGGLHARGPRARRRLRGRAGGRRATAPTTGSARSRSERSQTRSGSSPRLPESAYGTRDRLAALDPPRSRPAGQGARRRAAAGRATPRPRRSRRAARARSRRSRGWPRSADRRRRSARAGRGRASTSPRTAT